MDGVLTLAMKARVKQLYLFHHDPEHDDDQVARMVQQARQFVAEQKSPLMVDAAREGLTVPLPVQAA